jgi:hypothetical protein
MSGLELNTSFGSAFSAAKRMSGSGVHRIPDSLAIREKNES